MSLIYSQSPDIVCFQELSFENLRKIKPQLDSIYGKCDTLKGDNQLWRLMFYSNLPLRNFKRYHCEGTIDTSDFDSLELKEYEIMKNTINTTCIMKDNNVNNPSIIFFQNGKFLLSLIVIYSLQKV